METKHEKIVKITKRIVFISLGLMFAVRYFDNGNYSDKSVYITVGLAMMSSLAFLYRLNFEIKNKLFDVKKNLPSIIFLVLTIVIFILFYIYDIE
ncbi:hypothetical protein FLJC2902T_00530 [Flavobacterium limnosediminis JC2902]|uniref:Uncharacterized protein n=1 Tax=Flavobacterium limnosediminis JC2902 TaxID=1341181 RepID=V6SYU4_9FLAO|nr:hypothetical protein FLJC2902T_00530 [Flavobacterium limnosediminis JC2902]